MDRKTTSMSRIPMSAGWCLLVMSLTGCGNGTGVKVLILDDAGLPLEGAVATLDFERPPAKGERPDTETTGPDGRCSLYVYHDYGAYTPCLLTVTKPGFARHKELVDETQKYPREIFLAPLKP